MDSTKLAMNLFSGYFIAVMMMFSSIVFSQNNQKAFYVGHSLSDQIPDMVKSLAIDHSDVNFDWVYQSIPGSPLRWSWDHGSSYTSNPPYYYGYNHTQGGLPNGSFSTLVLTESVPRNMGSIAETYQYAKRFYDYAIGFNPETQVYIYEVWHCLKSGTPTGCDYDTNSSNWRQRLTDDLPMWEGVVNYLNSTIKPEKPIRLIPGGQGLARLNDEIERGNVPEVNTIDDLFSDDIHLNNKGKYFIACVHFATFFGKSPVGLTNQLQVWWGGNFENPPSPQLARRFQEIAWDVVTEYIDKGSSITEYAHYEDFSIRLSPSVADNFINITSDENIESLEIFDLSGKKIEQIFPQEKETQINITAYKAGLYFAKINSLKKSTTKQFLKK